MHLASSQFIYLHRRNEERQDAPRKSSRTALSCYALFTPPVVEGNFYGELFFMARNM